VNDPTVSAAAAGPHPYDKPYTSFRGHSQVTQTDPYGNQTITAYYQDDVKTGRSSSVTIKDYASGLKTLQVTTTTYGYSQWAAPTLTDVSDKNDPETYQQPYDPLYCRFVYTSGDTKAVYKADGVTIDDTLSNTYAYDSYGNQITKTTTGGGVTLVTHTDYFHNTSAWLVGLPARTWVTDGTNTLTESLNLYDGANAYDVAPTVGVPTATRSWMGGTNYSQTSMTHDAWGNVNSQTTWSGYGTASSAPTSGARTNYTAYDSTYHAYAVSTTDALNHTTSVTYNYSLGLPVSETDPNNATTSVTYDSFGRFTGLTKPGDATPTLTVSYQTSPFVVTLNQVIDATHTFTVTRYYDGLGRQYQTNTNGVLVNSTFNAFGKALTQSTPHSGSETVYYTTSTYDALGRVLTVTAPDGTVTTSIFDGLTTSVRDANNHTHTTVNDILGRTLSVTPPTGPAVSFTYDALGNMLTATRGGATVSLTYDVASRKIAMSDPDLGNWSYNYDALAMTSQTDARGCITNFDYDLLGRPLSKTYSNCPSTPNVSYTYDSGTNGIGRRSSMGVSGGDYTSWTYDARGRVLSENKQIMPGGGQYITYYTYNSADLPVSMTYPDGEVVNFTYNNQMLLNSVIGTSTYVQSTAYDSASRMTSRTLGNGLTQNYTYYAWNQQGGRLQTLSAGSLQNFTYQYDPVGNILSIADSVNSQTQTFTYDALDRLVTAGATGTSQQGGYATETYGYDSATGNLSSKVGVNYTYDATHKHAVASLSNGNSYSYDANGNMTTRNADGNSYTFTYDAENRLVSVSGDTMASFTYSADGARVKSMMDGETMYFVGGHYEVTGTGAITKYYSAGGSLVALRKGGTLSFILADHLGSTSLVTDSSGNRISELRYKPWGETRFSFGAMPTKYTFTGQFSYTDDPSTQGITEGFGLIYYNARWYDPYLNRFAQADSFVPRTPQGMDRYAYVSNNPLSHIDPTGHCEGDPDDRWRNPDYLCWKRLFQLDETYSFIYVEPENWTAHELLLLITALAALTHTFGSVEKFGAAVGNVTIVRSTEDFYPGNDEGWVATSDPKTRVMTFYNGAFDSSLGGSDEFGVFTTLHEFGHMYDFQHNYQPSKEFSQQFWSCYWYSKGECWLYGAPKNDNVARDYSAESPAEDFADSFAVFVWLDNGGSFNLPPEISSAITTRLVYFCNLFSCW
jgi:RHS repeat-associated protein